MRSAFKIMNICDLKAVAVFSIFLGAIFIRALTCIWVYSMVPWLEDKVIFYYRILINPDINFI